MLRYLILSHGFNTAVRGVATLTTITCLYSFIFCTPNPKHEHHTPEKWLAAKTWFDSDVKSNKAFWWFVAAVAFMFFGFYPVFFNLEEVCGLLLIPVLKLTSLVGIGGRLWNSERIRARYQSGRC